MQMSAQGVAMLEHHEGVVLKAYRDPVGIWTIGAGLTAPSGVVKPRAGMVISRAEATRLLQLALRRNYEPSVAKAMPGARQTEFDAGASFHFNTSAIAKATWVKRWRAKADASLIRSGLMAWNKGGGRVLPGLTRRRADEADLLLNGRYAGKAGVVVKPADRVRAATGPRTGEAVWVVDMPVAQKAVVAAELHKLGYLTPLSDADISARAVLAFQRDHDLTVDGIIGRATLSTLQRRIDAAAKSKAAVAAPALAAAAPASGASDMLSLPHGADWIILGLAAAYGLWVAWQYRDAIAAKIQTATPRIARLLRSF